MAGQVNNSTTTLRIMHCLRAPLGGLFRHVCDLIRGQKELGHSVGVICDIRTGDALAGQLLASFEEICDLGVHRLTIGRRVGPRDLFTFRQIGSICEEQSPDILHGHGAKGGAFARLLAGTHGAASVYTPHGGSLHYSPKTPEGLFYIAIERALRSRTNGIIFESEYAHRCYTDKVGTLQVPSRLIVNGLRDDEFSELG
ncbi:MAG: glycosyltransferase, partial [Planctomycetota bacterium]|nr:glycosyltransferase [Planctomycetota bacterium]